MALLAALLALCVAAAAGAPDTFNTGWPRVFLARSKPLADASKNASALVVQALERAKASGRLRSTTLSSAEGGSSSGSKVHDADTAFLPKRWSVVTLGSEEEAQALRESGQFEFVVPDALVRLPPRENRTPLPPVAAAGGRALGATTNPCLDRLDSRFRALDGSFTGPPGFTGANVDVYIMDTGVRADHTQFGGRVATALGRTFDPARSPTDTGDCDGHGTFVASQAAGATLGVAPGARIIPVAVFNCQGSGATSWLVSALGYILNTVAATGRRSVINFSGGGVADATSDALMYDAAAANVLLVVAAGNENVDACTTSPARGNAFGLTVGSTVPTSDARSDFSNFGGCVDVFGPGSNNVGASHTGATTAVSSGSGTSYSAPLVAGIAAALLGAAPINNWLHIKDLLLQGATPNVLLTAGLGAFSPNLLAYAGPQLSSVLTGTSSTPTGTFTPSPLGPVPSGTPASQPCADRGVRIVATLTGMGSTSGNIVFSASSARVMFDGPCTGGAITTVHKDVVAIDLGPNTPLGGLLTVSSCTTSFDNVIHIGFGCPASLAEYGCLRSDDDVGCGANGGGGKVGVVARSRLAYVLVRPYAASTTRGTYTLTYTYRLPSPAPTLSPGTPSAPGTFVPPPSPSGTPSKSRSGSPTPLGTGTGTATPTPSGAATGPPTPSFGSSPTGTGTGTPAATRTRTPSPIASSSSGGGGGGGNGSVPSCIEVALPSSGTFNRPASQLSSPPQGGWGGAVSWTGPAHLLRVDVSAAGGTGGRLTVTTCGPGTPSFDTLLNVFAPLAGAGSDACPATSSALLTPLGGNDDIGAGCGANSLASRVEIPVLSSAVVFVWVRGYGGANGAYEVTISYEAAPPSIGCAGTLAAASGTFVSNLASGTQAGWSGPALGLVVAPSWRQHLYVLSLAPSGETFTPGGNLMVTTCWAGSTFDTMLLLGALASNGTCPSTASAFNVTHVNDNARGDCGTGSRITVGNVQSRTLGLLVTGYDGAVGAYNLSWSYSVPLGCTSVQPVPAPVSALPYPTNFSGSLGAPPYAGWTFLPQLPPSTTRQHLHELNWGSLAPGGTVSVALTLEPGAGGGSACPWSNYLVVAASASLGCPATSSALVPLFGRAAAASATLPYADGCNGMVLRNWNLTRLFLHVSSTEPAAGGYTLSARYTPPTPACTGPALSGPSGSQPALPLRSSRQSGLALTFDGDATGQSAFFVAPAAPQHLRPLALGPLAALGGSLRVSTCSLGTDFDTVLALLGGPLPGGAVVGGQPDGCPEPEELTSLPVLAVNDDAGCTEGAYSGSTVTLPGVNRRTFFVLVAAYAYTPSAPVPLSGSYGLAWAYTAPPLAVTATLTGLSGQWVGDLASGTHSGLGRTFSPELALDAGRAQHLLRLDLGPSAALGGPLTVSTCNPGTVMDTLVVVGTSAAVGGAVLTSPAQFTLAGSNDNDAACVGADGSPAPASSRLTVTARSRYVFVAVAPGVGAGAPGGYKLTWSYVAPTPSTTRTRTFTFSRTRLPIIPSRTGSCTRSPAPTRSRTRKAK